MAVSRARAPGAAGRHSALTSRAQAKRRSECEAPRDEAAELEDGRGGRRKRNAVAQHFISVDEGDGTTKQRQKMVGGASNCEQESHKM